MASHPDSVAQFAIYAERRKAVTLPTRRRKSRDCRMERARQLVRDLDRNGYHHLAYSVMFCASDTSNSHERNIELSEFEAMARRLLKASDQAAND